MASTTTTPHPAKFSEPILRHIGAMMDRYMPVTPPTWQEWLDPFGGVGRAQLLRKHYRLVTIVELEEEWANQAPDRVNVHVGDCKAFLKEHADFRLAYPRYDAPFHGIVTSPCYGNRMADRHTPRNETKLDPATGQRVRTTWKRHTYRHYLDRPLTDGSTAAMQWGPAYRQFHSETWELCSMVVRPGGLFILNISDHYRQGQPQGVPSWHKHEIESLGFKLIRADGVQTRRLRHGKNAHDHDATRHRMPGELVYVFRKE